jgi:hypothetical protein
MTRKDPWRMRSSLSALVVSTLAVLLSFSAPAQTPTPASPDGVLDESRAVRREGNAEGVSSQKRVDEISDETERLFAKYSNTLRQIDSARVYNAQMEDLITSQRAELASTADQLDRVEEVGRGVTPLMARMIAALEAFVDLDIPFLLEERQARIQGLHEMMRRADVTNSEKFRIPRAA